MGKNEPTEGIRARVALAVSSYWRTREAQKQKQQQSGRTDQGHRAAVTGGAHMDEFIQLFSDLIAEAGMPSQCVFRKKRVVALPGFFRPTKEWDVVVVKEAVLVAAIEAKAQVGSFGNNFNNRTEEAMGSALDLWTAYREGAYHTSPQPFLGYFFMLEDCAASNSPVRVNEPHFEVFPEFEGASYMRRYELFCRKLVRERHYSAAAFITSNSQSGIDGRYKTPAEDLSVETFARALAAHVSAQV